MGGTGLHVSKLLVVPGTDIHWGDAVNTASKLSEDAQQDSNDLIITEEVRAEIEASSSGATLTRSITLAACSFNISKVQLPAFRVFARDVHDRPRSIALRKERKRDAKNAAPALSRSVSLRSTMKLLAGGRAALVTDMSGFTRNVRAYGIVHFASLIVKMRAIFMPHLLANNAEEIMTEADNFIVVFKSAEEAMNAAMSAKTSVEEYNSTIRSDKYKVEVGGYGLAYGDGTIRVDPIGERAYGVVMDRAYHLGEEVAEDNIVVCPEFAKALARNTRFAFEPVHDVRFGGVCFCCFFWDYVLLPCVDLCVLMCVSRVC